MIRVLVDSREQDPFKFREARCSVTKLDQGDYCLAGDRAGLVIERKSVEDLFGTMTKGAARFDRELARLRGCLYPVVIVEGLPETVAAGARFSQANGSRVLDHVIRVCIHFGINLMFCYGKTAARDTAWRLLKARHELRHARV